MLESIMLSGLAWSSYLVIHRVEAGVFIDPRQDNKVLPEDERNWLYLALSAALFSVGMIYGAQGVSNQNFIQSTLGAATLLLGYFIAHFEFSDKIV
ncbi:hypothetical protein GKQ38_02710 [Candidatus Nanohaloarchaea archaeon]|nr:hypothetical protein GKQ38_02710 [Candidatus Nanohaloarchaea archaeon]